MQWPADRGPALLPYGEWTGVILNTGNGLKDVASPMMVAGEPTVIPADPAILDTLFGGAAAR